MTSLIRRTNFPTRLLQENVKNLEMRKLIHTRSIVFNRYSRDNMRKPNALIAFYSKCAAIGSFNQTNIQHIENGIALDILRLFKSKWVPESYPLNEYVSAHVITSCITLKYVSLGKQCHGYLLKSGSVYHKFVKIPLMHLYGMLSDVLGAMEVLVSVPGSDIFAYDLFEKEYLDDAYNILRKMMAEDMEWNKANYIRIFGICTRLYYRELGRQVHNKLLRSDVDFDVSICNAVVYMYWKCGHLGNALFVFDTCKARDVVTWTAMMAAYSDRDLYEESLIFFPDMLANNIAPNESTFSVLLNSSAELFSMRFGNLLHAFAQKTGFKGHKNVEDALISMYLRTGDIKAAEKVFLEMTCNRDIETWNMMICGYSLHGFGNKSLGLFLEMLKIGEDPDYETFIGVLNACGNVEQGLYYLYEVMKQNGVKPGLEHYRYIMNILIKIGQLDEAFNFMVSTPIRWDGFAWSTLLNDRDAHRYNISARLPEFFPDDMATHMSKLCKVKNVHEVIEGGIKNDTNGVSWVEVKQKIYSFDSLVNGDPNFVEYHKIITPWFASIKAYGNVLHDDVKEKDFDGYHIEELAVVFALLKTPKGAPICIIKKSGMRDDM